MCLRYFWGVSDCKKLIMYVRLELLFQNFLLLQNFRYSNCFQDIRLQNFENSVSPPFLVFQRLRTNRSIVEYIQGVQKT